MSDDLVIVTGGGGSIGSHVVRALVAAGTHVVAVDIRLEHMRSILADIAHRITFIEGNVTVAADLDSIVEAARGAGRIVGLVNTAGEVRRGALTDISDAQWDETFDLCLRSAMRLTQRVLPELVSNAPGAIVNITSIHQRVLAPRLPAYSSAKAGLVALTQQIAVDYGRLGVRANAVSPGFIATTDETDTANNPVLREQILRATPSTRGGVPADVGAAVAFLMSPESTFINGAELVVDGGASLVHSLSVVKPELTWRVPGTAPTSEEDS